MIVSLNELEAWRPPHYKWLISDGLLIPGSRMVVYGPKKSWKSMLISIDLAFKLASGARWLDFNTRQSSVLVLQFEIPMSAFKERVMKYVEHQGLRPENLWFWHEKIEIGRGGEHSFNYLLEQIHKHKPDILIIDPLYKMIRGDISNNYDMKCFTDSIDKLLEQTPQLAIIIVHHKTKGQYDAFGEPIDRGSEASLGGITLNNWYDTGIGISLRGEDKIHMSFDDMRLAPDFLKPIDINVDRETLTFNIEQRNTLEVGLL